MKRADKFVLVIWAFLLWAIPAYCCHPECTWQCNDPVCPAFCQINCSTNCPTTTCEEQGCLCESLDEPRISDCTPPLSAPCTTCHLEQRGQQCRNANGQRCTCNLSCEQTCNWECTTPNCPKPTCELQCEQPACDVSVVFPEK